jgi:hypothetical protein
MKQEKPRLFFVSLAFAACAAAQSSSIIMHRGVYLEENPTVGENTIPAFLRTYALGYRAVEVDIRTTSDGVPIMMHDTCPGARPNNRECMAPGRTTSVDNNNGLLSHKMLMPGGAAFRPSPQGIDHATFRRGLGFVKVHDAQGNLVRRAPELRVNLSQLLEEIIKNPTGPLRQMEFYLDIQSPVALDAAFDLILDYYYGINGKTRYNFLPMFSFKLWTTAFAVDCENDPIEFTPNRWIKYGHGEHILSINPITLALGGGQEYTTVTQVCRGVSNPVSIPLSTVVNYIDRFSPWVIRYESLVRGTGDNFFMDQYIRDRHQSPTSAKPQPIFGIARYYDASANGKYYTCTTDNCKGEVVASTIKKRINFAYCHTYRIADYVKPNPFTGYAYCQY